MESPLLDYVDYFCSLSLWWTIPGSAFSAFLLLALLSLTRFFFRLLRYRFFYRYRGPAYRIEIFERTEKGTLKFYTGTKLTLLRSLLINFFPSYLEDYVRFKNDGEDLPDEAHGRIFVALRESWRKRTTGGMAKIINIKALTL